MGRRKYELSSLFRLPVVQLQQLLSEETAVWIEKLQWDFRPAADLVTRYVGMHALDGVALTRGDEIAGYSYFITEQHKGLIGDLYVSREHHSEETVSQLLAGTLDAIVRSPYVTRVEAQVMLLGDHDYSVTPANGKVHSYRRLFMSAHLDQIPWPRTLTADLYIDHWSLRWMHESAALIEETYRGHVDSQINDQYRDAHGAHRFLQNIVQYPGCGQFCQPASWLAAERATGKIIGISLASRVASTVGHVTQICVDPKWQGHAVGYELLRHSLQSLREQGCNQATLTVTEANQHAADLYRRAGFHEIHAFYGYVWDNFLG